METTADLEAALEKFADKTSLKEPETYMACVERISSSILTMPLSQRQHALIAMNAAQRAYFSKKISARYRRISKDILGLKRKITLEISEYSGRKYSLLIPVFAYANLKENKWKFKAVAQNDERYPPVEIELEAKLPLIPQSALGKAKEAECFMFELYIEALPSVIGNNLMFYDGTPNPARSMLNILWIPTSENIEFKVLEPPIKSKDPALVIDWENCLYLVAKWNVEHEEPFEHYLNEYEIS
jgi:hypothetical protein